ncbi:hypothetical protein HDR70_06020 [bacterium]|nr:hypothetical protein [bacterium]
MKKTILLTLSAIALALIIPYFCATAQNKTVVEGRYWNYGIVEWRGTTFTKKTFPRFHFQGTIELNGKQYSIFRDKDDIEAAYMRENDNQVFLYCGSESPTEIVIDNDSVIVNDEIMIYDFNLTDNVVFPAISFGGNPYYNNTFLQYGEIMDCHVIKTGTSINDNQIRQLDFKISTEMDLMSEYAIHYFIEGIGCTEGFLPFPHISFLCSCIRTDYIYLIDVEDEQGNIIFNPGMLSEISEVSNDNMKSEPNHIFDLHGREVSNPLPGSIYIRNGKKFVAKD